MTLNFSVHIREETTVLPEGQFYVHVIKENNVVKHDTGMHLKDDCIIIVIFASILSLKDFFFLHFYQSLYRYFVKSISYMYVRRTLTNKPNI